MSETDEMFRLRDGAIALTAVFVSLFIAISLIWIFKYYCCPTSTNSSSSSSLDMSMVNVNEMIRTDINQQNAAFRSSEHPIVPFSTKVRSIFLEKALQHETFHPKTPTNCDDLEKGHRDTVKPLSSVNNNVTKLTNNIACEDVSVSASKGTVRTVADGNDNSTVSAIGTAISKSTRSMDESIRNCSSSIDLDNSNTDSAYCDICYETLHDGDDVTTSNCQKTFHRTCIITWLMQHDTCPYCRNTFKDINNINNTIDIDLNAVMNCD